VECSCEHGNEPSGSMSESVDFEMVSVNYVRFHLVLFATEDSQLRQKYVS
jgi:hypothetical protein